MAINSIHENFVDVNTIGGDGYRYSGWGETISGTGTVDGDAASSAVGSPSLWGPECLQVIAPSGEDSYLLEVGIAGPPSVNFMRFEFYVSAESLADGETGPGVLVFHGGGADNIGVFLVDQVATNQLRLTIIVYHDGTSNTIATPNIVTGQRYRLEFMWDVTGDVWQVWLDGSSQGNGTITSTPASTPWHLEDVLIGGLGSVVDGGPTTIYYSMVTFRDARVDDALYPARTIGAGALGDSFQKIGGGLG